MISVEKLKSYCQRLLVKLGEAVGEQTWNAMQKGLKSPGLKVNTSSGEKRKFVKEAGNNYQRQVSARERKTIEDVIVQQLRDYKEEQ